MLLFLFACDSQPNEPPPVSGVARLDLCDALDVPALGDASFGEDGFLSAAAALPFGRARPHRPGGHAFAWALVDPAQDGARDWSFPDAAVRALQAAGVAVVGTLENAVDPREGAGLMELYVPREKLEGFQAFVRDLVERYDGDGHDDMPGLLAPVAAWEIGNEPSCDPDDHACEDAFVERMDRTAAAARGASEDVEIYPGAAAPPFVPGEGLHENPRYARLWERWLETGDRSNIDGLVVHTLVGVPAPGVAEVLAWWRDRAPDLPLTVGELGSRGVGGQPRVRPDPEEEAAWLTREVDAAFEGGARRVGWCHTRHDPEEVPEIVEALRTLAERHGRQGGTGRHSMDPTSTERRTQRGQGCFHPTKTR
jgi:hypothetical protein